MAITKTYSDGGSGKHCKLEPLFIAPLSSFYFTDDEKTPLAAPHIDIYIQIVFKCISARVRSVFPPEPQIMKGDLEIGPQREDKSVHADNFKSICILTG